MTKAFPASPGPGELFNLIGPSHPQYPDSSRTAVSTGSETATDESSASGEPGAVAFEPEGETAFLATTDSARGATYLKVPEWQVYPSLGRGAIVVEVSGDYL